MHKRDLRDYRVYKLSASDKGRGITVAATASPGTLIHTALGSKAANDWDLIILRVVNTTGSAIKLTLEWGGTATGDQIEMSIPAEDGFTDIVPGLLLQDGAEVRAFADSANGLVIHGLVHRHENSRL